jgi:hemerythrin superfamily protein
VFDPLDHAGIPVGRHDRHWHELDGDPIDARATDPSTLRRISMVAAVEANAERFARRFADRVQDVDARRSAAGLGDATARRRQHIAGVSPSTHSAAEDAIDRERAAFELAGWAARNEDEPDRSSAYQQQAWQHLERLRRYAELADRAHLPWAGRIADEVDSSWPRLPSTPSRSRTPAAPAMQPLSLLYDWMVQAADQWTASYRPQPRERGWEALVVQESAGCYLYYAFMAEEDDRRLSPMWELHLQMRLAHLRTASDMLRRHSGRDPHEVTGAGLPEPETLRTDRTPARAHDPDRQDRARSGRRHRQGTRDRTRQDREQDVLEVLTAHHARTNRLFDSVVRSSGDDARMAFGDLAQLIAMHEVAEERTVHPLIRRLRPDDHLADRLLDEQSRVGDALSDAVRAAAHGRLDDTIGGLRDVVTAHSRGEEHDEFPELRGAVEVQERTEMGRAVRAAEAAAAAEAGPRDPAWAGPRAVARTTDRVRDALAGFS